MPMLPNRPPSLAHQAAALARIAVPGLAGSVDGGALARCVAAILAARGLGGQDVIADRQLLRGIARAALSEVPSEGQDGVLAGAIAMLPGLDESAGDVVGGLVQAYRSGGTDAEIAAGGRRLLAVIKDRMDRDRVRALLLGLAPAQKGRGGKSPVAGLVILCGKAVCAASVSGADRDQSLTATLMAGLVVLSVSAAAAEFDARDFKEAKDRFVSASTSLVQASDLEAAAVWSANVAHKAAGDRLLASARATALAFLHSQGTDLGAAEILGALCQASIVATRH